MKHLKRLMLLIMAGALLTISTNSAAGSVLTSPAGTNLTVGSEIHMTLATPNSSLMKAGLETTCGESTLAAFLAINSATSASGEISKLSFGDCTKTMHVLVNGSLSIASGGAFSISGNQWTYFDLGVSCVYGGGNGTNLGTLKGGAPAVLEVSTTALPKISGGFLCASTGTWTAKYTVTTPGTLLVD